MGRILILPRIGGVVAAAVLLLSTFWIRSTFCRVRPPHHHHHFRLPGLEVGRSLSGDGKMEDAIVLTGMIEERAMSSQQLRRDSDQNSDDSEQKSHDSKEKRKGSEEISEKYKDWLQAPPGKALETVQLQRKLDLLQETIRKVQELSEAAVANVGKGFRKPFKLAAWTQDDEGSDDEGSDEDDWSEDDEGSDDLEYPHGRKFSRFEEAKEENAGAAISTVPPQAGPESRPVPLFQQYHKILKNITGLDRQRPPANQTFNCMLDRKRHHRRMRKCDNWACTSGNCYATAKQIFHDYSRRDDLIYPLHEDIRNPGFYDDDIPVKFMNSEQVHDFFFSKEEEFSLLGVHEFCDNVCDEVFQVEGTHVTEVEGTNVTEVEGTNVTCSALEWTHVYVIERHGKTCSIMQSDENYFQLYHFMGGNKSKLPETQRNLAELKKLKRILGYDSDDIEEGGVDCLKLYKRYKKVYRKLSYIREFEGQCLDFWWNYQNRKQLKSIDFDSPAPWGLYRYCFDKRGWDDEERKPLPGDFIKKALLDIDTASLEPSLSGSGYQCVPVPFRRSKWPAPSTFDRVRAALGGFR